MGIVVAVIDGGINNKILKGNIIDQQKYGITEISKNGMAHGTACAKIIKEKMEEVEFIDLVVLDQQLSTNYESLQQALEYCSEIKCDVINLSLSFKNANVPEKIDTLYHILDEQGKVVVAAVENGKTESTPAQYPTVIGVNGAILKDGDFYFNPHYKIQSVANIYPEYIDKDNGQFVFFSGNSKATAIMTGVVGKGILKGYCTKKTLCEYLVRHASKHIWNTNELDREFVISEEEQLFDSSKFCTDVVLILEKLGVSDKLQDGFLQCGTINIEMIGTILNELEKKYILKNQIPFTAFNTVAGISSIIIEEKKYA